MLGKMGQGARTQVKVQWDSKEGALTSSVIRQEYLLAWWGGLSRFQHDHFRLSFNKERCTRDLWGPCMCQELHHPCQQWTHSVFSVSCPTKFYYSSFGSEITIDQMGLPRQLQIKIRITALCLITYIKFIVFLKASFISYVSQVWQNTPNCIY